MSSKFKLRILIFTLVLTILTLSSFSSLLNVNGQENKSLDVTHQFHMLESSFIKNDHQNANDFDITLPSSLWTVKSMELNFTDIQFTPNTEIYEDTTDGINYYKIWYQNPVTKLYGVAVQINLTNPTTIYGAYIYANYKVGTTETIKIQIRGNDATFNRPNGTIYASSDFNVSDSEEWYWQDLPVSLSKGSYFLVINGSIIGTDSDPEFYWYSNAINPINPTLKVLDYYESWENGTSGIPLFKLVQKENTPVYPEDISMEVEIGQDNYTVSNGPSEGKGYLKLSGLNYYPNSDFLNLSVFNNISNTLLFNASSFIGLEKISTFSANLRITENQPNQWTLTPTILRTSDNCCVQFEYPRSWENISIYKNSINITSQVIIDEGYLIITNKTISGTSDWEIKATSPLINFDLNVPITAFKIGDELIFALTGTPPNGNYTFILYDITDVALEPILKQIPPDNEGFSFSIPTDFHEGNYRAVVFWNNLTDGGVKSQLFELVLPSPTTPDNTLLIMIGLIIGITSAVAIFAYVAYKKIFSKREYSLELILNKCVDVSNINLIIIMDKNSGIDLFSRSFSGKKIDPTLVSGFLQAIRNFGAEISEASQDSRTLKLEYKDSILLMNEFVNLRVIVSMKENPSKNFVYSVDDLAYDIYKNYGDEIEKFRGNVKKFRGIDQLIEKHLGVSFILPMKVMVTDDQKLTFAEKQMVDKALTLMEDHDMDTIYSLYLLPENECSPKDYKTILNLIQKGVFKPIQQ
ncbi:MAG: hypothetical protein ACTSXN_15090 [Promethearchaeota archaeon]